MRRCPCAIWKGVERLRGRAPQQRDAGAGPVTPRMDKQTVFLKSSSGIAQVLRKIKRQPALRAWEPRAPRSKADPRKTSKRTILHSQPMLPAAQMDMVIFLGKHTAPRTSLKPSGLIVMPKHARPNLAGWGALGCDKSTQTLALADSPGQHANSLASKPGAKPDAQLAPAAWLHPVSSQ